MDSDKIRGSMHQINIDSDQKAHNESARILKDAIEKKLSYAVISCMTKERAAQLKFDGETAHAFGDIILGNVKGFEDRQQMFLLTAILVKWTEVSTELTRAEVFSAVMRSCRILDQIQNPGTDSPDHEGPAAPSGPVKL